MPLNNLIKNDKTTCLEELEKATDFELWDVFLEGQAKLFFDSEFKWIHKGPWWHKAQNILEIGSGGGAYLYQLSSQFKNKTFRGIEKLSPAVKKATEKYANAHLTFQEGDGEILNHQLSRWADIVLFRLTLQHLKNPATALINAATYLSAGGYVVIIDSYDQAKQTSHPITAIDEALERVAEAQKKEGKGSRKVTFELLEDLQNEKSTLNTLYEVASNNLDADGNVVGDVICFQGEKDRIRYFNHNLLFSTLLHRTYHVQVDLNKAYDELQDYLYDEKAWTSPGTHLLVLKKKITHIQKTP